MKDKKTVDKRPIKDLLREKDAFLTTSERIHEYFLRHTKGFIIGTVVVAVSILAAAFYHSYDKAAEAKGLAAFELALESGSQGTPGQDSLAKMISTMEAVRSDYSGRKAARLASLALANLYDEKGETDKALALAENLLQTLKSSETSLKPALLYFLGGLYEKKNDSVKAVKTYETLLTLKFLDDYFKADILLALARINTVAGANEAAMANYTALLSDYPYNPKALWANARLAELKGAPQAFPLSELTGVPSVSVEAATVTE